MATTITLSGRLTDLTSRPIDPATTTVTVKAPAYAPGPGVELTTTQPAPVAVGEDGEVTLEVVQGVGWLIIDGPGWSDSIRFVAAPGMLTLWEAVVNALPHVVEVKRMLLALHEAYMSSEAGQTLPTWLTEAALSSTYATKAEFLLALRDRVNPLVLDILASDSTVADAAAAAVSDAVEGMDLMERSAAEAADQALGQRIDTEKWKRGIIPASTTSLDQLADGVWSIESAALKDALGLPGHHYGDVQMMTTSSGWRTAIFVNTNGELWAAGITAGATPEWRREIYAHSSPLDGSVLVEDLPTGLYRVGNGTVATNLGLPAPSSGSLWVHRLGDDIGRMEWRPTNAIDVYHRRLHGTSWTAWESLASGSGGGTPAEHNHDDRYYTKAEVDRQRDPSLAGEITGVSITLEGTDKEYIPNCIGVDGILYGHVRGGMYPVRFPNSTDSEPEFGPRFDEYATSGGWGIAWVERTSTGYVVIWAVDARNSEFYFSENWEGPYEKVLDAGPWNLTGRSKSRLINGVTWLMWGEYHNHLTPNWPLKRWLSTDGGQSWKMVRETIVNDDTINSHHHAGLIRADGRIYSSEGDGVANAITVYSDDLGKSWIPLPEPDKLRFDGTLRMYHQPTMMIDFGDYIATSPDSGPWKPGMWLMDPNTHDREIIWELEHGGPYAAAHLQYGRSLYAQEGPTGHEVYVMFPDGGSGNRTSYVAATPDAGRRWGVVAEIPTTTGQLNTGVIGPDRYGYCYMRGIDIPTYGSNLIRFKKLDWAEIDY